MGLLIDQFEERLREIDSYIDFLGGIENLAQSGIPRLGIDGPAVTVQQTRILYSSVYLQLYNLVESTVTRCLDSVTQVAIGSGKWMPNDLVENLRREWVRVIARSHTELNYENRLSSALALCEHLVSALPVTSFKLEKGGGGNWDDKAIEAITRRIGCKLTISRSVKKAANVKLRDDKGALGLVVKLRNDLAHGSLSFAECGENDTASELRILAITTGDYMRDVVKTFERFISDHEFLRPERRPVPA